MPSINGFTRTLSVINQSGKVTHAGTTLEITAKTPSVKNTASILMRTPFSINNLIKDTVGRLFFRNTILCNDGIRVYKLNGKDSNYSTITILNNEGIRVLREIWGKAGTIKQAIYKYDENGLNPIRATK